ncbi:MAG TPA: hypothetical protein VKD67_06590, partial [Acidimicrobiales bacterium]|nr:hypothetical protein [Acidimicrobiales bacterium]
MGPLPGDDQIGMLGSGDVHDGPALLARQHTRLAGDAGRVQRLAVMTSDVGKELVLAIKSE